jgi:hypothetical protein
VVGVRPPSIDDLRGLVDWEAPHGVLSIYLEIDPGDRGEPWKIALRDQLDAAVEAAGDLERDRELALRATVGRVRERFEASEFPSGRMQIGFVACSTEKHAREAPEEWFSVQHPVMPTRALYNDRPSVRGLAELVDDGRARGVVAISSERVRLFDWRFGEIEEIAVRELELLEPVWRERKAPQMRDPASGQAVSSAGKDQHGQRVDQQRRRFLKEAAQAASEVLGEEAAREILCIGEAGLCEDFIAGWPGNPPRLVVDHADVITEPAPEIAARATAKIAEADAERDRELVDRAVDGAAAGGHGALGIDETAQALAVGQVERLLIDPDRDLSADALGDGIRAEIEAATSLPADPLDEWFARTAIRTSATITAIRDEPAQRLAEHGGVAAILRYV